MTHDGSPSHLGGNFKRTVVAMTDDSKARNHEPSPPPRTIPRDDDQRESPITTTAFCSRPPPFQGREQNAANQSARSKSSGRDAQQRGATAAPHDHDYPGLSRIRLDYPER
jgi:hypothetical protein